MKLLEDAYIALDSIEREKERDREMYEMEIEKLRRQPELRYVLIFFSTVRLISILLSLFRDSAFFAWRSWEYAWLISPKNDLRTDRATKKQEELLLEAFGSMNLGTRPEDDEVTPQDPAEEVFGLELPAKSNVLEESFGVEVTGKIRQMGAQVCLNHRSCVIFFEVALVLQFQF